MIETNVNSVWIHPFRKQAHSALRKTIWNGSINKYGVEYCAVCTSSAANEENSLYLRVFDDCNDSGPFLIATSKR
jgi:hypothetical protein